MRMFQVDAFTDRVFAGNPAAVLVLDDWLDNALMLAIAQENNLAETAFIAPREGGGWRLRWFAPAHEVDFCGHATLATAHVLATEHGVEGEMVFDTRVGELRVQREENAYRLDVPRLDPEPMTDLPSELESVFGEPPAALFRNFENIYADLGSERAVRAFVPDLLRISRLGPVGLVVTGRGDGRSGAAFVSRYFAPGTGNHRPDRPGANHALTLKPDHSGGAGQGRCSSGVARSGKKQASGEIGPPGIAADLASQEQRRNRAALTRTRPKSVSRSRVR